MRDDKDGEPASLSASVKTTCNTVLHSSAVGFTTCLMKRCVSFSDEEQRERFRKKNDVI